MCLYGCNDEIFIQLSKELPLRGLFIEYIGEFKPANNYIHKGFAIDTANGFKALHLQVGILIRTTLLFFNILCD